MATWNCSCSFLSCSASAKQPGMVKLAISIASVFWIQRITLTHQILIISREQMKIRGRKTQTTHYKHNLCGISLKRCKLDTLLKLDSTNCCQVLHVHGSLLRIFKWMNFAKIFLQIITFKLYHVHCLFLVIIRLVAKNIIFLLFLSSHFWHQSISFATTIWLD